MEPPWSMLEYAHKKISPDESEDLPGLSAGSSDSEELPDPTRRKVSSRLKAVKGPVLRFSQ
jgi:hypothetical protein